MLASTTPAVDYKALVQDNRIHASLYTDPRMPEDLIVAGCNQLGFRARTVEWLLLGRGLNREHVDGEGRAVSHVTDETTNRALWRHYRTVMTEA
jgi:hypothetical protein